MFIVDYAITSTVRASLNLHSKSERGRFVNTRVKLMNCPDLVIATGNAGKFRELAHSLLSALPMRLGSLADFPGVLSVAENGQNFRENAELKACGYARQTLCRIMADDSGLEVDALGGAPGVFSARYGGEALSDADRTELLLGELIEVKDARRTARFVCAIAVADEAASILGVWTGVCEGTIARRPAGAGGFGYDPIFIPRGYRQTFGELPPDVKQQIGHRARALAAVIPFLKKTLGA